MTNENILDAIGMINEEAVRDAKAYRRSKSRSWVKWGAMAACLCLVIGIAIPMLNHDTHPGQPGDEIMINTKNLDIYYVSENGAIESKNIEVRCTAEDIFNEWAALNGILDVTLVDCVYDNGATVNVRGDENDPEAPVEHFGTDHYTLTITLSKEFSKYAESSNGDLLIESLKETFINYNHFDEFNLIIES